MLRALLLIIILLLLLGALPRWPYMPPGLGYYPSGGLGLVLLVLIILLLLGYL